MKDYSNTTLVPLKGIFGCYLKSNDGVSKNVKKKLGKIGILYIQKEIAGESRVLFKLQNDQVVTSEFSYINFYSEDQAIISTFYGESKYINVNFSTGQISPEFRDVLYPLFFGKDNRLFEIDTDGNFLYNDFYYPGCKMKGDLSYKYLAVMDKDGKVGIMEKNGKLYYPCKFDSAEGLSLNSFKIDKKYIYQIHDSISKKLILKFSDQEIEIGDVEEPTLTRLKEGYFSIYDKGTNKSFVYQINKDNSAIKEVGLYNDKITKIVIDNKKEKDNVYFINENATNLYTKGGVCLLSSCSKIEANYISDKKGEKEDLLFCYKQNINDEECLGVYSSSFEKVVLDPNLKCHNVSIGRSLLTEDNTINFLTSKLVVEDDKKKEKWGIVDSEGKIIQDFVNDDIRHNNKFFKDEDGFLKSSDSYLKSESILKGFSTYFSIVQPFINSYASLL